MAGDDLHDMVERLAKRLEGTPLYEGCGEDSAMPEEAAVMLRALRAENERLRVQLAAATGANARAILASARAMGGPDE